jgi:hypothetical protein
MIGEHLFSYASFGIDPLSEGANDRLYVAVLEKRSAIKATPQGRAKQIRVASVWPRGDDLYFEVFPTSLYEEAEDQAAQTLTLDS